MKNILGIGKAGFNIVKELGKHKNYKPFVISKHVTNKTKYRYPTPDLDSPEDFENLNFDKLGEWLSTIKDSCTVFLCGASLTTGLTLRVLENFYKRSVKVEVVYISPEVEVLSKTKFLNQRVVMGVLQNYARSGLLENIYLASNEYLEQLSGPTNVYDYFDQINKVLTNTYYMLDVFKNTKPITSTFTKPGIANRIRTFGVGSIEGEDVLFFPFKDEVEVVYYFAINEKKLKTEENLFRKLTDKVKSKITKQRKVSFGIFPTNYEEDYVYVEYLSPIIQEINIDKQQ